jgi:Spy/CpxP family protein refolding chaperone
MRKTWIYAGALVIVAAAAMEASAHGRGGGRGMGMGMGMGPGMGMIKGARMGLAAQLGLTEEQQAQLEALRTDFAAKDQALREEEQAAFKALLTEEQQAALDAAAAAGRGRHRRGPVLNLSDEQKTQLEVLRTEYRDKHQALHAEFQTAFEALLTEEQKAELAELKAAGPFGACIGAGAETGTSSTDTDTGTGSTATLSAAKLVSEDEPAAEDQLISWGQLKNADSE